MSDELKKESIKSAIISLALSFDEELFAMAQNDLEQYWFFSFKESRTIEENLYEFHDKLRLYGDFCRRWEERHNGHCCVVERVRDTYLMPKIQAFAESIKAHLAAAKEDREQ